MKGIEGNRVRIGGGISKEGEGTTRMTKKGGCLLWLLPLTQA
jgi:hypothetical protein